jgi:ribose transport system substrate-binding protein
MKKTFTVLFLLLAMGSLIWAGGQQEAAEETTGVVVQEVKDYPPLDLNPTGVLGLGPEGQEPTGLADLSFTEEELKQIRDGKFKAVLAHHQMDNAHNQQKDRGAIDKLEELGIEVVANTDAQYNVERMVANIESSMALEPDVLIGMPFDPDATAGIYKKVAKAGVKIVFMENTASGMVAGKDYVALVNPDSYGVGKAAADIMANKLNYSGKVGMVFYDVNFFVTNERDKAFREVMARDYPDIEIVAEFGFADPNKSGESADALFARYPDIDAVYCSWDQIAAYTVASAKSNGLTPDDVFITTVDLSADSALGIATDDFIKGTGAPRSYDTGVAEAMAAAYSLIGKPLPSTYISTPAYPTVQENVIEAFKETLHMDPPQAVIDAWKKHNE